MYWSNGFSGGVLIALALAGPGFAAPAPDRPLTAPGGAGPAGQGPHPGRANPRCAVR